MKFNKFKEIAVVGEIICIVNQRKIKYGIYIEKESHDV
jgi:hypothetical protein